MLEVQIFPLVSRVALPVAAPAANATDPVKLIPKQTSDPKHTNSLSALGALALNFIASIS